MNQMKMAVHMSVLALAIGSNGLAIAASVPGTASATVVTPVTVSETTPLAFGAFAVGTTGGLLTIDPLGAHTAAPDITVINASTRSAATFTIDGEPNTVITVGLNGAGAQLDDGTAAGGGAPMALNGFTDSGLPVNTGAAGSVTFGVGATLNVNASQGVGSYSTATGDGQGYTITVNYN